MGLDLPSRHPSGIQRDDLVVKSGDAALSVRDQLRLEVTVSIAGNVDGDVTLVAFEGFAAGAIAGIATATAIGSVFLVAQVVSHFSLEDTLNQVLGQLFQQTILAEEIF